MAALRDAVNAWRRAGEQIAFVPTMGNLHAGHMRLVEQAKQRAQRVVVSIFVNPMQFGAGEDFGSYPRTLSQDSELLQSAGVDLLFTPPVAEIYGQDLAHTTRVEVPGVSDILCGAYRPGHFVGVTTVVAKLFNMVQPDIAVFGKKDYQQLHIIKRMVNDLAMPIEIVGVDTKRESNGLAMSSRNGYLSADEKQLAAAIYQSMTEIADKVKQGGQDFRVLERQVKLTLSQQGFQPDYVEIRHRSDLSVADDAATPLVVLVAAKLGAARLIDNLEID